MSMSVKKTSLSNGGGSVLSWRASGAPVFVIHGGEGHITLFHSSQK